jgi:phenylacetate-CoA ligase
MTPLQDDRFFDPAIETMPREQLEQLQEHRILRLVPYAYQRSALIREVWDEAGVHPGQIRSLADFKARVPFIDKDRIRRFRDEHDDPYGGLVCVGPPHLRGVGFTSGTTGDPTPVPRADFHISLAGMKRELWEMGMRAGDYMGYCLFTFREGLMADRMLDADFRPVMVQHLPSEVSHLVKISRQFRPVVLFMLSTPLIIALDQYQRETGDDLAEAFSSYKGVVFGGEPLSPFLRRMVESWGLEIFELTSLGDISTATDCRAHAGMHTWEDLALVEHLDPQGSAEVADGERGELVVTALLDDVAPLIRYRTDDLIEFTRKPCICGRTHGRFRPLGRKGDEMVIAGRSVLPLDLYGFLEPFEATRKGLFQLVRPQREMSELTVRVGYEESAVQGSLVSLEARIAAAMSDALGVVVNIELRPEPELLRNGPPNKIPRVVER